MYAMTDFMEKPNSVPWPPIILVCTIAIGFIVDFFVPLSFPRHVIGEFLHGLGFLTIVLALLIDVAAMTKMHKHKTAILPHKGASKLLTDGVFAFSRNPIYLANMMLIFGLGLAFGNWWLCVLMVIAGFATQKLAIEREEKHLDTKFGRTFRSYKKKVNRWI